MGAYRVARIAALVSMFLAGGVAAQGPIPTDAAGRPIVDASGRPIPYSTKAVPKATAAPAPGPAARIIARKPDAMVSRHSFATAALATGANYVDRWRLLSWGTGIGLTGFWPIDVDNDGTLEFVTGGGWGFGQNNNWSIVGYDQERHEYRILWQSPATPTHTPNLISAARVVEAGGTKRVWLGYNTGSISVVDAPTRNTFSTIAAVSGSINDLAIADADNNGSLDVVALTSSALYIYDAITANLVRTENYGGSKLDIGNIDSDPNLEIVLNTGRVLEITTGSTTVQLNGAAFGLHVQLANIDSDSFEELVASEGWYHIKAWDLDVPSVKWDHATSADVSALRLFDVTGDGVAEVLYGDGQSGGIHALAPDTGTQIWMIPTPSSGITDIAVFDADHDGELELLWATGWHNSAGDFFFVHDIATRQEEWTNVDFTGPYRGVDVGDVDGDGGLEIVAASLDSESGYGGSVLSIFDAETHDLEWQSTVTAPFIGRVNAIKIANVDADPQAEIIIGSGSASTIAILDGVTHAPQLQRTYDYSSEFASLDVADVDGDGTLEIVAGSAITSSPGPGNFLYVIDPATGDIDWQSATLTSGFGGVRDTLVTDLPGAGRDIVSLVDGAVYRLRWSDKQLLSTSVAIYRSIAVADVLAGGTPYIIAGRADGTIEILDPTTLASVGVLSVCSGAIPALREHGPGLVAFSCGTQFGIYNAATQSLATQTQTNVANLGDAGTIIRTTIGGVSAYVLGGYQVIKLLDVSGNSVPMMQPASFTSHWRSVVDMQISASDANGDPLTFDLLDLPTRGSLMWMNRPAGVLRYGVSAPWKGTEVFHVRAFDGFQYSSSQAITLTLTNTAPAASTSTISLHWRGPHLAQLAGTDTDGDPLVYTVAGTTQRMTPTRASAATGGVDLAPDAPYVGTDSLTYQVSDGVDVSAVQTVTVNYTNTAPVAQGAAFNITVGIAVNARVNASDANSDPLSYEVVQQATKGAFTLEATTGLFQYTPANGGSGTDTVTVAATDGMARSQTVTLEFRYPGGRGGGGGGGRLEWLTLLLLLGLLMQSHHLARRQARAVGARGN